MVEKITYNDIINFCMDLYPRNPKMIRKALWFYGWNPEKQEMDF